VLANLPDDAEIDALTDAVTGKRSIVVEHYSWTEPKTIEELLKNTQTATLTWTSEDVEKMFLEEKGRAAPLEEINDILLEFDNEVHDRLKPHGNELMREIINRV